MTVPVRALGPLVHEVSVKVARIAMDVTSFMAANVPAARQRRYGVFSLSAAAVVSHSDGDDEAFIVEMLADVGCDLVVGEFVCGFQLHTAPAWVLVFESFFQFALCFARAEDE